MSWIDFLDLTQSIVDGVMFGATYALIGIGFTLIFRIHPIIGIEGATRSITARHFTCNLRGQIGYVAACDIDRATLARKQPRPRRLSGTAKRRHHADPRYDDTPHGLNSPL